jgi:hypothetical protein
MAEIVGKGFFEFSVYVQTAPWNRPVLKLNRLSYKIEKRWLIN